MSHFEFEPAPCIPFRDKAVIERLRRMTREEILQHPNPDYRIAIHDAGDIEFLWIADMFARIKHAADHEQPLVMILPQPYTGYWKLAHLINAMNVDCRRLHTFNMDEYADQDGNVAPADWPHGFTYSLKHNLYGKIDPKLRPAEGQMIGLTNQTLPDYGKRLSDLGGADICYSGPGWTGHLAFIEPDAPEFAGDLETWKTFGPRVCTLSPFTLAQNSLSGSFGMSGDLTAVPPKAATIGPAQVIEAKHRIAMHAITVDGSYASWQRLASRLATHGPVTPRVPESILQTLRSDVWISELIAQPIEPQWHKGY